MQSSKRRVFWKGQIVPVLLEHGLSARAHDKIVRVAQTIADLEGVSSIEDHHIEEAIDFRMLDRDIR